MVLLKVILGGPKQSGKSVLREGLKQAIRRIPGAQYPYVITACPDGEGAWFQETVRKNSGEARDLKEEYKSSLSGFSPEFVKRIADSVKNCDLPMTLIDIGGRISPENREICQAATHAVLIAGDETDTGTKEIIIPWEERLSEWREFCEELHIEVIAILYSDYYGDKDEVWSQDQDIIFRGSIHYLERGVDVSNRPTIKALAQWINFFPKAREAKGKGN